jgi:hypothetical protein
LKVVLLHLHTHLIMFKENFQLVLKFGIQKKIQNIDKIEIDIYNDKAEFIGEKGFYVSHEKNQYINNWISSYKVKLITLVF